MEMSKSPSDPAELAAFLTRNAVDCLPDGELIKRLTQGKEAGKPLRVKLGIDPTTSDIHLGHTVVLQKLREFQDAGHTVVLIIGDFTARVGDPSGRDATRPVLSEEEIVANAQTYQDQAAKILATGDRLEVRYNSEWLEMGMAELFKLMRSVTVAQILEREDFSKRWQENQPISLLETIYPILQGYDSVAVNSDVELGGTDQIFNLLMGRAIQTSHGQRPQIVLTTELLNGTDGVRKMSKSYGNFIGITESANEIYGKAMSIPDSTMASWYELLFGTQQPKDLGPRDAKRKLARALAARYHGKEAGQAAEENFDQVFVAHKLPDEIEEYVIDPHNGSIHLPELIATAFGGSRSDARRQITQGGVKLDGDRIPTDTLDLPPADLDGRVLQVGKRRFKRLRVAKN
jgi:tyrosyl-tRNA synthetase